MNPGTHELTRADAWWHAALTGSAALAGLIGPDRCYPHVAPADLAPPPVGAPPELAEVYAVWTLVSPLPDVAVIGAGARVIVSATYTCVAVGPVPPVVLEPVADAIDAAVAGVGGPVLDGLRATCRRTAPLLYPEPVDGRLWWRCGGTFDLEITT